MESLQYEAIDSPFAQPRATDMDLIEASYAVRDHESFDKILVLMRHGEAKHNVFERDYAQTNGTLREEANEDPDYPIDPMLTGKVGHECTVCAVTCILFPIKYSLTLMINRFSPVINRDVVKC